MPIAAFNIEKEGLNRLLNEAEDGRAQLPDFQREWKWDDEHIRSLLASVSLGYPIGAIMMLRTGGEGIRFQHRTLQGVPPVSSDKAERLILDGQQRLTSLIQSLQIGNPVQTFDHRGNDISRWYYIDMKAALDPHVDREDAVISIPEDKVLKTDFGRKILDDFSTPDGEYRARLFPLANAFDSASWRSGYIKYWGYDETEIDLWDEFEQKIVKRFEQYHVPVIELDKDTPKEAVCQVFEKVNTGGVTLTVFELLTATFAADDFPLRTDWAKRERSLHEHAILGEVSNTDFLQAITLLATFEQRNLSLESGTEEDRAPRVGCKRIDMLRLSLSDYEKWADRLTQGFKSAARFLHSQHLYHAKFLPYGSQLIPLAAILTVLDDKWDSQPNRKKLARWYWCGVFGELYGGSTETRFARDLPEVVRWIRDDVQESATIYDAEFAPARLLTLRTRNSAAYKGVYSLLLREGAKDWMTGEESETQSYFDESIDIHHIFPQKWCKDKDVDAARCDSIINKTPLTAKTNRRIGGEAPSIYLRKIINAGVPESDLGGYLQSHLIKPEHLKNDNFDSHFKARRTALLEMIHVAMGKDVPDVLEDTPDIAPVEFEVVQGDSMTSEDAASNE